MTLLIPIQKLSEFLPDQRRPALPDILARTLYLQGAIPTTHTTLAVNDTQTEQVHEVQRIKEVTVGTVAGGTVTVQVYVNGVPMFLTGNRPVSGGAVRNPDSRFNFGSGSIVETVIEATTGAPTGEANVNTLTEPLVFVPKTPEVKITGKDRLFPSRQRAVQAFNDSGDLRAEGVIARASGGSSGVPNIGSDTIVPVTGGLGGEPLPDPGGGGPKPGPFKPPKKGGSNTL